MKTKRALNVPCDKDQKRFLLNQLNEYASWRWNSKALTHAARTTPMTRSVRRAKHMASMAKRIIDAHENKVKRKQATFLAKFETHVAAVREAIHFGTAVEGLKALQKLKAFAKL